MTCSNALFVSCAWGNLQAAEALMRCQWDPPLNGIKSSFKLNMATKIGLKSQEMTCPSAMAIWGLKLWFVGTAHSETPSYFLCPLAIQLSCRKNSPFNPMIYVASLTSNGYLRYPWVSHFHVHLRYLPRIKRGLLEYPPCSSMIFPANETTIECSGISHIFPWPGLIAGR